MLNTALIHDNRIADGGGIVLSRGYCNSVVRSISIVSKADRWSTESLSMFPDRSPVRQYRPGREDSPLFRFSPFFRFRHELRGASPRTTWKRNSAAQFESGVADGEFVMIGLGDFAARMGVCSNTVRNWIADGKLVVGVHYLHIGNVYRFPWSDERINKLMQALSPERPPARPPLRSQRMNRSHLKFRA